MVGRSVSLTLTPAPGLFNPLLPLHTKTARMQVHGGGQGGGGVGRGSENGAPTGLPEAAPAGQPDASCRAQGENALQWRGCVKVAFQEVWPEAPRNETLLGCLGCSGPEGVGANPMLSVEENWVVGTSSAPELVSERSLFVVVSELCCCCKTFDM